MFSSSVVKTLAESLAQDFNLQLPPAVLARGRGRVERQFQSARDKLMHKIDCYAETNKVGFFQRAIFANTLKWQLREAGYERDLVDALVLDAVRRMAYIKAGSKRAG